MCYHANVTKKQTRGAKAPQDMEDEKNENRKASFTNIKKKAKIKIS